MYLYGQSQGRLTYIVHMMIWNLKVRADPDKHKLNTVDKKTIVAAFGDYSRRRATIVTKTIANSTKPTLICCRFVVQRHRLAIESRANYAVMLRYKSRELSRRIDKGNIFCRHLGLLRNAAWFHAREGNNWSYFYTSTSTRKNFMEQKHDLEKKLRGASWKNLNENALMDAWYHT